MVKTIDLTFSEDGKGGGVLFVKDRLSEAPSSGYSDVLLNVCYSGQRQNRRDNLFCVMNLQFGWRVSDPCTPVVPNFATVQSTPASSARYYN